MNPGSVVSVGRRDPALAVAGQHHRVRRAGCWAAAIAAATAVCHLGLAGGLEPDVGGQVDRVVGADRAPVLGARDLHDVRRGCRRGAGTVITCTWAVVCPAVPAAPKISCRNESDAEVEGCPDRATRSTWKVPSSENAPNRLPALISPATAVQKSRGRPGSPPDTSGASGPSSGEGAALHQAGREPGQRLLQPRVVPQASPARRPAARRGAGSRRSPGREQAGLVDRRARDAADRERHPDEPEGEAGGVPAELGQRGELGVGELVGVTDPRTSRAITSISVLGSPSAPDGPMPAAQASAASASATSTGHRIAASARSALP